MKNYYFFALISIFIFACDKNKDTTHVIFRERIKISLPNLFLNTSDEILLNDSGQNAKFSSKDSSVEISISLEGDSIFHKEYLQNTIESELLKRHRDIRTERKTLNLPIQNAAVFYSYTSNNTFGVSAYIPFQNQKLRLDYQDQNIDGKNEYDRFLAIVESIVELNDI